ncbi:hypothetical protein [Aeromicrobium sp. CTD01-1L150]|uniref:hypothetical protein n=1 Tax=Aeromicrobium sp. CTD01-1L150 TaxID=3341830 RepID=UPI0035C1FF12
MSRGRILLLIVAPTIVAVTIVAVVVVLLMQAADRREQVERADAAAAGYTQAVEDFKQTVESQAESADFGDAQSVGAAVTQASEDLPELPDATEHGIENSAAYRDAAALEEKTAQDLQAFQEVVETTAQAEEFVAQAEKIMQEDPFDYLDSGSFTSGAPIRRDALPPMQKALSEAEALEAPESPESAEEARKLLVEATRRVVRGVKKAASELDAGRGYKLRYDYGRAPLAVRLVSGQAQSELREAFDRLVADEPDPQDPDAEPDTEDTDTEDAGTGV